MRVFLCHITSEYPDLCSRNQNRTQCCQAGIEGLLRVRLEVWCCRKQDLHPAADARGSLNAVFFSGPWSVEMKTQMLRLLFPCIAAAGQALSFSLIFFAWSFPQSCLWSR